jgi:uncharacterized protein
VKLHASGPGGANTVTAYGAGYVSVNGQRHESSLVVLRDRILPWAPRRFDELNAGSFAVLEKLDVDILLLGTGERQRFPLPQLTAGLRKARIGVEVMDLQAACRTYNILVAEERKVAAALLIE